MSISLSHRYKSLSSLQLTPDSNPTAGLTPPTTTISAKAAAAASAAAAAAAQAAAQAAATTGSSAGSQTPPDVVLKCGGSILNAHGYLASHSRSSSSNNHHNPREGTLDSSRSGGRTSGDSQKLPEKKTRRLSRPRSLSNLVWDLRPSKEKSKKKLYIHHFDQRQQATLYL